MSSCSIKTPTVTTKDGQEIESPLYKQMRAMVNPLMARELYNITMSEDFKSESFWGDIALNNYVSEYGEPTIEGLMKYTDFGKQVSLSDYADNVKEELFDGKIEIKSTQDLINSLVKVRDWNKDNKYYKAIIVKESNGVIGLKVAKNTSKVAMLNNNIEDFLDLVEKIDNQSDKIDLFDFYLANYNVYSPNSNFNVADVVNKLRQLKDKSIDYISFNQILKGLPTYSNNIGFRVIDSISSNTDFIFNYIKQNNLTSLSDEDLKASIENNPKMFAGIIKNHLLYQAYTNSALGDVIMGLSNADYMKTLIQRLSTNLTNDINSIEIPNQEENNTNEPAPSLGVNVNFYNKKIKDLLTSETDVINKILLTEQDIANRTFKSYGNTESEAIRAKLRKLNKAIDSGNTYAGLLEYVKDTIE
jgi:hypothetical protein